MEIYWVCFEAVQWSALRPLRRVTVVLDRKRVVVLAWFRAKVRAEVF
jgi:hypothetical protein